MNIKSQVGFSPVHILLLLVLSGIIGFTVLKIYDANKSTKSADSSTVSPIDDTPQLQSEQSGIPKGFVEYKNEEFGFKFAYPKEWGQVLLVSNDGGRHVAKFASAEYGLRVHNKDIGSISSDDFIKNVKQLIKNDDGRLVIRSMSGDATPDKVFIQEVLCAYEKIALNEVFNTEVTDVEQFLHCSLQNEAGVVIVSHNQIEESKANAIESILFKVALTFRYI